jgi:hypothetical protein
MMAIFTVHEPPRRQGDLAAHADGFIFLRDRFSWPAFLVPPLWMLRHRLWLALAGYVLAGAGLVLALRLTALPAGAAALIVLLLSLLIGIEAAGLRRLALARRRYAQVGVVVADDVESAERRFFDAWVAEAQRRGPPAPPRPPAATVPATGVPTGVLGLFPEPGVRR